MEENETNKSESVCQNNKAELANQNNKAELVRDSLILASTLIELYCKPASDGPCYINHFEDKRERIDSIINYSIRKTLEANKRLNPNPEDEIYSGDLVILSIDDKPPTRYLITRIPEQFQKNKEENEKKYGIVNKRYDIISDYSILGKELLGRHRGEEFTYNDDVSVDSHTIKILDIQKTKESFRVSRFQIEADENYTRTHTK